MIPPFREGNIDMDFTGTPMSSRSPSHPELRALRQRLQNIYEDISNYRPSTVRFPILDSSIDLDARPDDDSETGNANWSQQGHISGLRKLKESLKIDLDGLQKFLDKPNSGQLPALSTNAPYLISVWNEVLCAPPPVQCIFRTFLFDPANPITSAQRKQGALRPPGAKVDVIADNGRQWIRINTIKNSRFMSELREIDSYLTDSDSDPEWDAAGRPSLAQVEFDNSILKMGRTLLAAAKANPVEGTSEIPRVVLRLTRLDPTCTQGPTGDPRIGETIELLKEMGVQVELGERAESELPSVTSSSGSSASDDTVEPPLLVPSPRINLDLSVLIALISDLIHARLPLTLEEAQRRFIPPKEYRDWKEKRRKQVAAKVSREASPSLNSSSSSSQLGDRVALEDLPHDLATHSRALRNQLLQEMGKSMIQEMQDRLATIPASAAAPGVEFWTTPEARDRCLRIVSKIGGPNEKRRAHALFCIDTNATSRTRSLPVEEAERLFWQGSRFGAEGDEFVPPFPLFPLHFHSPETDSRTLPADSVLLAQRSGRGTFGKELAKTCADILAQETVPHPRAAVGRHGQPHFISQATFPVSGAAKVESTTANGEKTEDVDDDDDDEIQRASVTKVNPRLTAHTVESLAWGAELGWTTLTANRTSVKAILKEMRAAKVAGRLDGLGEDGVGSEGEFAGEGGSSTEVAAIWIVDPRSLAEQMSSESPS